MTPIFALALAATLHAPAPAASLPPAPLMTQAVTLAMASPVPAPMPPGGDSLRNGAITGAVYGGLIAGALVGTLCYLYNDGDNRGRDCTRAAVLWTGIGAAGGAALGAGVDALFVRIRVKVR